MKNLFTLLLFLICFGAVSLGQQRITIVARGETTLESALPREMLYAFDQFTEAKIIMKDGTENDTRININLISKDILFLTRGNQILVLAFPEEVKTILVESSVWVPVGGTFAETILNEGEASLLRAKQTRITDTRKEGGFGFSSSTSSVTSVTSYVSDVGKISEPLAVGEYDFETTIRYTLLKDSKTYTADSKGFLKVYPAKKKEIKNYLKNNPVDFKNEQELMKFLKTCSEL